MRPQLMRQRPRQVRHPRPAQAIAAGGEHHMPGIQGLRLRANLHRQLHQAIGTRSHPTHPVLVTHLQRQGLAIPAQVVGPLQARDLVQLFPGWQAELRFEPGAKRQRRQAQGRAGQLFRRTQGFHARSRRPGPFEPGGRLIEDHGRHAQMTQLGGQRQAGHAAADDRHVQHGFAGMQAWLDPGFGRQIEPVEILAQTRFQGRKTIGGVLGMEVGSTIRP